MEAAAEKARLSEMLASSETLCHFLKECVGNATAVAPCSRGVESYRAVAFAPDAVNPFSDVSGQQVNGTVMVGRGRDEEVRAEPLAEDFDSLELSCDQSLDQTPPPSYFSVVCRPEVLLGPSLPSQRVYLLQSSPLHVRSDSQTVREVVTVHNSGVAPLSLDRARYLCSLYALGARLAGPLPTMWVLCGSDKGQKSRVTALGCSRDDTDLHMLSVSADENLGGSEKETKGGGKMTRKSGRGGGWAFSSYDIVGSSMGESPASGGSIEAQFVWNQPDCLLAPPPHSADGVLRVSASPGYMFSPVLPVFQELTALLRLCRIAEAELDWPAPNEELPSPADTRALRAESFLEEVSSPFAPPLDSSLLSPTSDQEVYEPRKDLDFLERLWLFLREVASLRGLQEVLAGVFKSVLLGRAQPLVHASSSSSLAVLFRQALRCASPAERQDLAPRFQLALSGSKGLRALLEVGLEKLSRDYLQFFVTSELLAAAQLDGFLSKGAGCLEWCYSLCRLHCVLELSVLARSFLSLPPSALASLAAAALRHYRDAPFDGFSATPFFSLPLPAYSQALKSVAGLCASLSPARFSVSSSETGRRRSLTVAGSRALFGAAASQSGPAPGPGAGIEECSLVYTAACSSVAM